MASRRFLRDGRTTHARRAARRWGLASTALLVAIGCGDDESASKGGSGGSGASTSTGTEVPLVGAPGVVISEVAIYQGVKRSLMVGGAPVASDVPLVPGRDALLRVFYTTDPNYNGSPVTGRLFIDGQEPMETVGQLLSSSASSDSTKETTVNFLIPGAMITPAGLTYQIKLLQPGVEGTGNPLATYPIESYEAVTAGPQNTLRIKLAPFQYNADGSGRVPDLGPESLEAYRKRFMQWFPVSNVELSVREPLGWGQYIGPSGQGWEAAIEAVYSMRFIDAAPDDLYYYGLFNPTSSFGQYCGGGCLLGLTLGNNAPPPGDVELRFALGVGFPDVSRETTAHEIAHTLGRNHVNCGPGLNPDSIDFAYPYDPQTVGSWGWDMFSGELINPNTHTDFMGYCDNNWVSDYTYAGLHEYGSAVNLPDWHPGPGSHPDPSSQASPNGRSDHAPPAVSYEIVAIDFDGSARWIQRSARLRYFTGEPVAVTTLTEGGHARAVAGRLKRYDHMPGGWLFIEKSEVEPVRAEFVVDGRFTVATR